MIACAIEEMLSPFKGIEALIGFSRRQRDFGLCHAPFIGGPCLTHHLLHCLPYLPGGAKTGMLRTSRVMLNAMRHRLLHRDRGGLLTSLMLAVLLFRAYIPVGFMPASGAPFLLELCPAAASAPMPAHHHHTDGHGQFEHCPFGSVPTAGPISQAVAFNAPAPAPSHLSVIFASQLRSTRLPSAHQPRGPPSPV